MCRRRPIERIVGLAGFVGDRGAGKDWIDGGRMRRVGRPGVVHDALQFLHARHPPGVVAEEFIRVLILHPGQRVLPVQALAAIGLGPDQASGAVDD